MANLVDLAEFMIANPKSTSADFINHLNKPNGNNKDGLEDGMAIQRQGIIRR